jgi:hypothetical protein
MSTPHRAIWESWLFSDLDSAGVILIGQTGKLTHKKGHN